MRTSRKSVKATIFITAMAVAAALAVLPAAAGAQAALSLDDGAAPLPAAAPSAAIKASGTFVIDIMLTASPVLPDGTPVSFSAEVDVTDSIFFNSLQIG